MRLPLVLALLAAAPAAEAQSARPMPGVEYFCTGANGERYELGEVICITASCQSWMARCDMSLNNPMWRKVSEGCPGASILDRLKATRG